MMKTMLQNFPVVIWLNEWNICTKNLDQLNTHCKTEIFSVFSSSFSCFMIMIDRVQIKTFCSSNSYFNNGYGFVKAFLLHYFSFLYQYEGDLNHLIVIVQFFFFWICIYAKQYLVILLFFFQFFLMFFFCICKLKERSLRIEVFFKTYVSEIGKWMTIIRSVQ